MSGGRIYVSGVLVAVLLLCCGGATDALKCYACLPNSAIAGAAVPPALSSGGFPSCSSLPVDREPGLRFEMKCPPGLDKSCIKLHDGSGNEMRSCFSGEKAVCSAATSSGQQMCTCRGDFCNAAPSQLTTSCWTLAPAVATLVGAFFQRYYLY